MPSLRQVVLAFLLAIAPPGAVSSLQAQTATAGTPVEDLGVLKAAAIGAIRAKDWPQALSLWDRYLARSPDSAAGHKLRGLSLEELGRIDEAIVALLKATELAPTDASAWHYLCWTRILAEQPPETRATCERALSLSQTNFSALVNLGHTYLLQGDAKAAEEWYQKALNNIENDSELNAGLADFDLFIGKGWQVESSRLAKARIYAKGKEMLARKAPADRVAEEIKMVEQAKDYEKGIVLREQRISLLTSIYAKDSPRLLLEQNALLEAKGSYANYLYESKRYAEALVLSEQILKALEAGKQEDLFLARIDYLVANNLRELNRCEAALPYFRKSLAIFDRIEPEGSILAATVRTFFAICLGKAGLIVEAEAAVRLSVEVFLKLAPNSWQLRGAMAVHARDLKDLKRFDEFKDIARRARDLGRSSGDLSVQGMALEDLADVARQQAHFDEARELANEARAIYQQGRLPYEMGSARVHTILGNIALDQGQFLEAKQQHVEALEIRKGLNPPCNWCVHQSMSDIANIEWGLGNLDVSLILYQDLLALQEQSLGKDNEKTLVTLQSIAELETQLGRTGPALEKLEQINEKRLKLYAPTHPWIASTLESIADVYFALGHYDEAKPRYEQAMAIYKKAYGEDDSRVASVLKGLARVYLVLGRPNKALEQRELALAMDRKTYDDLHPTVIFDRIAIGNMHRKAGHVEKALSDLESAATLTSQKLGDNSLWMATAEYYLARALEQAGRNAEALVRLTHVLEINRAVLGPRHAYVANSLQAIARVKRALGEPDAALKLLHEAHAVALVGDDPATARRVLRELMLTHAALDQPDLAIYFGKQLINSAQQTRGRMLKMDKNLQDSFRDSQAPLYRRLADLLMSQGRIAEAQSVLGMLKEDEYADFVQRNGPSGSVQSKVEDTGQERPWRARYEKISTRIAALAKEHEVLRKKTSEGLSSLDQARKDKLDDDLAAARDAYESFMDDLKREYTQNAAPDRQQEFGEKHLDSLRSRQGTLRALGHGAVILNYLMTDQRLWILLTTPATQLIREAAVTAAKLNDLILQYREAIARRDPKIKDLGKALYELLIAPVAEDLKQADAQTLMLSLDGNLRYLPMAALFDGEQFLAQRYQLALYTAAALDKLKDKPQPNWTLAGYGLTQRIEDFAALPSVKGELDGILKGMKGSVKFDNEFTAKAFKTGLEGEPPVVHLASHFVFKSGNNRDSYLLLGDGTKLSLEEIKKGYEFINLDLLTLSACETAVGGGKDANGREVEGFGALAQNQGAKGVIATLWPVADQSTGQFMQLFYGFRQKIPGITKAKAMQMAQRAFIDGRVGPALAEVTRAVKVVRADGATSIPAVTTTAHPYFWAPFILMGNWL